MKQFMNEEFILSNPTAVYLYENYAKTLPIFDYHCHLSAKEIYENKPFQNIAEAWLGGDHYKWRMMRGHGIEEKYITGDADGWEKFKAYAEALPYAIGNPLYHWTHLELKRYFKIEDNLSADTAEHIWKIANEKIKAGGFTPQELIINSNVYALCTTEDAVDDLTYHKLLKEEGELKAKVLPAFRPDGALAIEAPYFKEYIEKLSHVVDFEINSYGELKKALRKRMDDFQACGCVASDHGFEYIPFEMAEESVLEDIFKAAMGKKEITTKMADQFKTGLMVFLGKEYHSRNWAMEIHFGVMRNLNTRMLESVGINTGFDSIADHKVARNLAALLNEMDKVNKCPKTILFSLNQADNWVVASMTGNFMNDVPGKIQMGTAWWMQDHRDGMEEQMKILANSAQLGHFIGMLTDSRSFLSYSRHEYFRRILCNLIGKWVEAGEFPYDEKILKTIIEGICFKNACKYLGV